MSHNTSNNEKKRKFNTFDLPDPELERLKRKKREQEEAEKDKQQINYSAWFNVDDINNNNNKPIKQKQRVRGSNIPPNTIIKSNDNLSQLSYNSTKKRRKLNNINGNSIHGGGSMLTPSPKSLTPVITTMDFDKLPIYKDINNNNNIDKYNTILLDKNINIRSLYDFEKRKLIYIKNINDGDNMNFRSKYDNENDIKNNLIKNKKNNINKNKNNVNGNGNGLKFDEKKFDVKRIVFEKDKSLVLSDREVDQVFSGSKYENDPWLFEQIIARRNHIQGFCKYPKVMRFAGLLFSDGPERLQKASKSVKMAIKTSESRASEAKTNIESLEKNIVYFNELKKRQPNNQLSETQLNDFKKIQSKKKKMEELKNIYVIHKYLYGSIEKYYLELLNKASSDIKYQISEKNDDEYIPLGPIDEYLKEDSIDEFYDKLESIRNGGRKVDGIVKDNDVGEYIYTDELNKLRRKESDILGERKKLMKIYGNKIQIAQYHDYGEKDFDERELKLFKCTQDNLIGSGVYGKVYKVHAPCSKNITCAVKTVELRLKIKDAKQFYNEGIPLTVVREISALKLLNHENITCIYDIISNKQNNWTYSIVMEYLPSDLGTIMKCLKDEWNEYKKNKFNNKNKLKQIPCEPVWFNTANIKSIMKDILNGLYFMEKQTFIHRDLKPQNLLLTYTGVVKIADFGLARQFKKNIKLTNAGKVVTRWYRAPEILVSWFNGKIEGTNNEVKITQEILTEYGTKSDMWSAGCIFVEIVTGNPLFRGISDADQLYKIIKLCGNMNYLSNIKQKQYYKVYNYMDDCNKKIKNEQQISNNQNILRNYLTNICGSGWSSVNKDAYINLICKIFNYDPDQRISAGDALKDEFFQCAPSAVPPASKVEKMTKKKQKKGETLHTNQIKERQIYKQNLKMKEMLNNENKSKSMSHHSHHNNNNNNSVYSGHSGHHSHHYSQSHHGYRTNNNNNNNYHHSSRSHLGFRHNNNNNNNRGMNTSRSTMSGNRFTKAYIPPDNYSSNNKHH